MLRTQLWMYAWGFILIESALVWMSHTVVFAPWFIKFGPLPNDTLRDQIYALADKMQFPRHQIYVERDSDGCYVRYKGVFSSKYILISDQAIAKLSNEDIVALTAHEIARWQHSYHLLWYIICLAYNGLWLYLLQIGVYSFGLYHSMNVPFSFALGYVVIQHIIVPVHMVYMFFAHWMSHAFIYKADQTVSRLNLDIFNALEAQTQIEGKQRSHDFLYSLMFKAKPSLESRMHRIHKKSE
jgi:STE24 endopeptidase